MLLASNNLHKLAEVREILARYRIEVESPADRSIELEVAESGSSFAENARLKAHAFCAEANVTTVADDSGLQIDALDGKPGIFSARFAGPAASDGDRVQRVLEMMADVPPRLRSAQFVTALVIARPNGDDVVVEGRVVGYISAQPQGRNGFGYDPIFFYPPLGKTFGQLSRQEKSMVSHRARAFSRAAGVISGL